MASSQEPKQGDRQFKLQLSYRGSKMMPQFLKEAFEENREKQRTTRHVKATWDRGGGEEEQYDFTNYMKGSQ